MRGGNILSYKTEESIRIALLHIAPKAGEVAYNRTQIRKALALAAGYEADVAITPELAESGIAFCECINLNTLPLFPNQFVCDLREVAWKYQMNLVIGLPEKEAVKGEIYNALVVITSDGVIQGTYRKVHLNGEREGKWVFGGKDAATQDMNGVTIGFMIGEDMYSPYMAKVLKNMGTKLIVAAAAHGKEEGSMSKEWENRSRETDLPILVCNRTGREMDVSFMGGESVAISNGTICQSFLTKQPMIFVVDFYKRTKSFSFVASASLRNMDL